LLKLVLLGAPNATPSFFHTYVGLEFPVTAVLKFIVPPVQIVCAVGCVVNVTGVLIVTTALFDMVFTHPANAIASTLYVPAVAAATFEITSESVVSPEITLLFLNHL
jgi:hypothetical protein